ncbi:WhiB family transcriptional regulator [Streptomyces roseus]
MVRNPLVPLPAAYSRGSRCLEWALEGGMDMGVCGGLTEEERRAVKRRAAREARARLHS